MKIVLSNKNYTALQIAEQAVRTVINQYKPPICSQATISTIEHNGEKAYRIMLGVQVFWRKKCRHGTNWVDTEIIFSHSLINKSEGFVLISFLKEHPLLSQTGIVFLDYQCPEYTHFELCVCSQSHNHARQLNKSFN